MAREERDGTYRFTASNQSREGIMRRRHSGEERCKKELHLRNAINLDKVTMTTAGELSQTDCTRTNKWTRPVYISTH
jgi:hypothetical protein